MKLGFVSAILPDLTLAEVLEFAAAEGYDCVELMCWPRGKAERRYAGVTHVDVSEFGPAQAAEVIDGLGRVAAVDVLAAHDSEPLASVWRHLSPGRVDEIVPELPEKLLKQALHALDPAVLAVSLSRISEESRNRCLALLPRRAGAEVRRLMDYPQGSAGRVMDSRVLSFRGEQPVAATLDQLSTLAAQVEKDAAVATGRDAMRLTALAETLKGRAARLR